MILSFSYAWMREPPGVREVLLSSYIIDNVRDGKWKRILFIPTGALLSTVSYNEGQSVPGIAHGVIVEHV